MASRLMQEGHDRIEVWDYDHFDPWETLHWPEVRVLRYRQHKPGTMIQAEWLTDFPITKLGSLSFYRMAKSLGDRKSGLQRWQEPIWHGAHMPPRAQQYPDRLAVDHFGLYRLRYLHRRDHDICSAKQLVTYLWLTLGSRSPPPLNGQQERCPGHNSNPVHRADPYLDEDSETADSSALLDRVEQGGRSSLPATGNRLRGWSQTVQAWIATRLRRQPIASASALAN